jgi:hypothetical protein
LTVGLHDTICCINNISKSRKLFRRLVWQTAYDRIFRVRQMNVCIYFRACKQFRVWMIYVRLPLEEVGRITRVDTLCWPCTPFGPDGLEGGVHATKCRPQIMMLFGLRIVMQEARGRMSRSTMLPSASRSGWSLFLVPLYKNLEQLIVAPWLKKCYLQFISNALSVPLHIQSLMIRLQ